MKRTSRISTLLAGLAFAGCHNMSHTERGAGLGGLVGAGMGAAIGSDSGNAGKGALIGAAAGAILGGAAGNADDKAEHAELRHHRDVAHAAAAKPPLGLTDVAAMTQQGVSDQIIVNQIRTSDSSYTLSPGDIGYLKQSGVSDAVIMEMQRQAPRRTVVAAPPPPRTVIVEHAVPVGPCYHPVYVAPPPPPPRIGVGFHYSSRR